MANRWNAPIINSAWRKIMTRKYTYVRPDGSEVIIQEHVAGHDALHCWPRPTVVGEDDHFCVDCLISTYNYLRYYDPETDRYASTVPLGLNTQEGKYTTLGRIMVMAETRILFE